MTRTLGSLVWLPGILILIGIEMSLLAGAPANLYHGIPGANVFHLRTPQIEPITPPPRRAVIRLTGIFSFPSEKRALLQVELPDHPSGTAKPLSFSLGEGQREGEIEVLEIDAPAGAVRVINFGMEMIVTFENEKSPTRLVSRPGPATK